MLPGFFKSLSGRYKRIRRRPAASPDPVRYAHGFERLSQLEALAEAGELMLFYGDFYPLTRPSSILHTAISATFPFLPFATRRS